MKNKQVNKSLKNLMLELDLLLSSFKSVVPISLHYQINAFRNRLKEFKVQFSIDNNDAEAEVEWIPTQMDDLTINQRMVLVDKWYQTLGFLLSSLGDDTSSLLVISPNHQIDEFTDFYFKVTGWVVEVKKSLASPFNGEYLREQPHNCFVVKVKTFAPLSPFKEGTFVYNVVCCKPLATVMRSMFGTENLESKSPLIREIGKLSRLLNVNLYPALDIVVRRVVEYGVAELGLFTKPVDYVPMANYAAWKKAGKPSASKYHVRIKDINTALRVAGQDALFLERQSGLPQSKSGDAALAKAIGQSWTKTQMEDYDLSKYMPSTRLCRYITAINQGNTTLAKDIIEEVTVIKTDIFRKYNYPDLVTEEEESTFIEVTN